MHFKKWSVFLAHPVYAASFVPQVVFYTAQYISGLDISVYDAGATQIL